MPRYTVDITWNIEWVIEAESAEAIQRALRYGSYALDDIFNDAKLTVNPYRSSPSSLDTDPDAVVVDDELLNPDDAIDEWERLVQLEGEKRIKEFEDKSGNLF